MKTSAERQARHDITAASRSARASHAVASALLLRASLSRRDAARDDDAQSSSARQGSTTRGSSRRGRTALADRRATSRARARCGRTSACPSVVLVADVVEHGAQQRVHFDLIRLCLLDDLRDVSQHAVVAAVITHEDHLLAHVGALRVDRLRAHEHAGERQLRVALRERCDPRAVRQRLEVAEVPAAFVAQLASCRADTIEAGADAHAECGRELLLREVLVTMLLVHAPLDERESSVGVADATLRAAHAAPSLSHASSASSLTPPPTASSSSESAPRMRSIITCMRAMSSSSSFATSPERSRSTASCTR